MRYVHVQTWAATLKNCAMTPNTYRLFDSRIFNGDLPFQVADGILLDDLRGLLERDNQPYGDQHKSETEIRTHHRTEFTGADRPYLRRRSNSPCSPARPTSAG